MERKQTFQKLKAPCVELSQAALMFAQNPSTSKDVLRTLNQLLDILKSISAHQGALDENLADYVFFPISHVLRASGKVPTRALELSLECLSILLNTGWQSQIATDLAGQLLILLTFLASSSSAGNGIIATSEELQSSAFRCLTELFTTLSFTPQGKASLTTTANIPALGHAVLIILEGITDGVSNEIQLSALAALRAVCSAIDDRDALASFLPRIVSSLTKILTLSKTSRSSYRSLERGLDVLSLLLLLVLSDTVTKDLPNPDGAKEKGNAVQRTSSWLRATASQIRIALANVVKLREHERSEVRKALLRLCSMVLNNCRDSLSESTGMMIETFVVLAGKDTQGTTEKALQQLLITDSKLCEQLRSSLHGWVRSLPRLMQSKDDAIRSQVIHQISVTIRTLNEEGIDLTIVDRLLASSLRDSISNVLQDSKGIGSIIESTPSNALVQSKAWLGDNRSTSFNPLLLSLKSQDETAVEFQMLLSQLATSDSSISVARDLISSLHSPQGDGQLSSMWLSLKLMEQITTHSVSFEDFLDLGTEQESSKTELLTELYDFAHSILADPDSDFDVDWRFLALALETIALQARQYKKEFRVELVDSLYPVIHLVGSSNSALRDHAITCLNVISDSCGYIHTSDLIVSNVDYLVNAVALRLNTLDLTPQAPQVLLMMIRLSGPSLLPYLDDLVENIFSALENFHGYPKLVELLFSVLKGIAEEGVKTPQLTITMGEEMLHQKQSSSPIGIKDVANAISAMKIEASRNDEEELEKMEAIFPRKPWEAQTTRTTKDNPDSPEESEENQETETTEPPPPAPRTFKLLLKISQLTQHYLTSSSPSLRTSLLSLLSTTIPALAKHENSFLPLVNTLWPVLISRLNDPEAYVVCNTLEIINMMCAYAGDFMKGRVEAVWEDIKIIYRRAVWTSKSLSGQSGESSLTLPILATVQKRGEIAFQATASMLNPGHQDYYVDAPTRLIWDSLLKLMSTVVECVAVSEEVFDDILDMVEPVLNREDVRKAMQSRNSDAIWLRQFKRSNRQTKESGLQSTAAYNFPKLVGKPEWNFVQLQVQ